MHEITDLISRFKSGDNTAAQEIFDKLFGKLVERTKRNFGGGGRRLSAEEAESLALSAFFNAFEAARNDKDLKVVRSGDLWSLLIKITHDKSVDKERKASAKKRAGDPRTENITETGRNTRSEGIPIDEQPSPEPNHEFLVELKDVVQWIRDGLGDPELERVFDLSLEGYTQKEIAELMAIGRASVSRKLEIIREDARRLSNER